MKKKEFKSKKENSKMDTISSKSFRTKKQFLKILQARLFSVMVVPYNKKSESSFFHFSLFSAIFLVSVFSLLLAWFVYSTKNYFQITYEISKMDGVIEQKKTSLAQIEKAMRLYVVNHAPKEYFISRQKEIVANSPNKGFIGPVGGAETKDWDGKYENLSSEFQTYRDQEMAQSTDGRKILDIINGKSEIFNQSLENVSRMQSDFNRRKETLAGVPLQFPVQNGLGEIVQDNEKMIVSTLPGSLAVVTGDGIVKSIKKLDGQKKGILVITISHSLGFTTVYRGLKSTTLTEGDKVYRGDTIGEVASTLTYSVLVNSIALKPSNFNIVQF